jgi:hypothetical protein
VSYAFSVSGVGTICHSQLFDKTGYNDIKLLDGYQNPIDDKWVNGVTYAYRDGVSIRPIEIEYAKSKISARIFAGSSPDDYMLALRLVEGASVLAGNNEIEPEDNRPMDVEDIKATYDKSWIAEHSKASLMLLLNRVKEGPSAKATMSAVTREVMLGPAFVNDLLKYEDNIAEEFFSRIRKLNYIDSEDVYQGILTIVGDAEGTHKVRIGTYTEGVPTLLRDKGTLVTLIGDDDLCGDSESDKTVITISALYELVGDKAVWLSNEYLLLPALQGESWAEFAMHAKGMHIEDIFEYGCPVESEGEVSDGVLSEEDLSILTYAPVLVFFIVAVADGIIDKNEIRAFHKEIIKGVNTDSDLMKKVIVRLIENFDKLVTSLVNKNVDASQAMMAVLSVLSSKVPDEESDKFKISMLGIGKKIAEASGGFLGIFGSKISKEEKAALDFLSQMLGVES